MEPRFLEYWHQIDKETTVKPTLVANEQGSTEWEQLKKALQQAAASQQKKG